MAGVSRDLLLEYIQRKGGRVKNVDLVKHFRKHLLFDDPTKKEQARETFKETVNSIAYIKQEEGEKFLYLKEEFLTNNSHKKPPPTPAAKPVPVTPPKVPLAVPSSPHHTGPAFSNHVQNGYGIGSPGGDLLPEHKSLSPQHIPRGPPQNGSPSRQRGFPGDQKNLSPAHVSASPPSHHRTQPTASLFSSSVPVSSFGDHFQQHGSPVHHHLFHSSGGKGHKKMSLEISRPMNVLSLSNGTAMNESSDLQKVTADLENFGKTGTFHESYTSSPSSFHQPHPPHVQVQSPLVTDVSHPSPPSQYSSSSSASLQSTSFPSLPSDQNLISPPIVTVTRSSSRGSQLGVKALIQQYTVPPGTVPSVSSEDQDVLSPTYKVKRSGSSASNQSSNSSLQFRREPTPPETRVQRSHSSVGSNGSNTAVVRRSRVFDSRGGSNETLIRQSMKSKLAHRLSKNSDELAITNSREELLSEDQDRESPIDEYYIEIDPNEKEWLNALMDGDMDAIHHLIMSDPNYVNRKGFINGWTALHWAAKLGREDMISALIVSGGRTDIKSNGGLTPLHIAAETGNRDIVRLLVEDYNACVNARDHSGRRPIDVVSPWSDNSIRTLLRRGLDTRSIPLSSLSIGKNSFNVPHDPRIIPKLKKQWGSLGHLSDKEVSDKATKRRQHHLASPKGIRKGFSFRRKKNYQVQRDKSKRDSTISEYYEHIED